MSKADVPKFVAKALHGLDPKAAMRAFERQAVEAADESLILWPIRSAVKKVLRMAKKEHVLKKVKGGVHRAIGRPTLLADMAVGHALSKIPLVGKSLFTIKEDLPIAEGLKKTITRASALGPLIKTRNLAEPILVGVGLEKGLKALNKNQEQSMQDKHLREKVASVMLSLHSRNKEHEKRAHALKLLYKQAELGLTVLPQSFSELETKLASLVTEDLVVLEKALELTGGNIKLGELGRSDLKARLGPEEKFQAVILGDEVI